MPCANPAEWCRGSAVTLINEANGATRSTDTNTAGEYAFVQVEPGTYTVKVTMQGFKTIENKGVRIGTQQFITLDLEPRGRQPARRQVTVEGAGSSSRPRTPRSAARIDSKTLQTLPTAGRNPFFLATIDPGRDPHRRPAVRAPAGPDQLLAALARGRAAARQQLHARRRRHRGHPQPRHGHPLDRGGGGSQGPGHAPTTQRWGAPAAASST